MHGKASEYFLVILYICYVCSADSILSANQYFIRINQTNFTTLNQQLENTHTTVTKNTVVPNAISMCAFKVPKNHMTFVTASLAH